MKMECLVCGKMFTRSALDLAKHQASTNVQHIVSTKHNATCIFECSLCHSWFTKEEHLKMHSELSTCRSTYKSKLTNYFSPKDKKPSSAPSTSPENPASPKSKDKTAECMVCGKLFPRGQLDLTRHVTALTLLHTYSETKTADCKFQCGTCGLYLKSTEHLESHKATTSCNPSVAESMKKPVFKVGNISSATTRHKMPATAQSSGVTQSSGGSVLSLEYPSLVDVDGIRASASSPLSVSSSTVQQHRTSPRLSSSAAVLTPTVSGSKRSLTSIQSLPTSLAASPVSARSLSTAITGMRRTVTMAELSEKRGSSKRTRPLIVEDRQVFYATVSLLMDPKLTSQTVLKHNRGHPCEEAVKRRQIINENIMSCIPEVNHPLVNQLKEILLYDCQ